MRIDSEILTGFQRLEAGKASRLRLFMMLMQFCATVPIAFTITVQDSNVLYVLAIIASAFLVVWWIINGFYQAAKYASQSARYVNLVINGLGEQPTSAAWQTLYDKFTVELADATAAANPTYYDSNKPPSWGRLAEIVEESAFYTSIIQKKSSRIMSVAIGAFGLIGLLSLLIAIPSQDQPGLVSIVRVYLGCAVFVMSSDFFGAYKGHNAAASAARSIREAMARCAATGYPAGDILVATMDYITSMATAPEPIPFLFARDRDKIASKWRLIADSR